MGQECSRPFGSRLAQAQPALLLKLPAELVLCITAQLSLSPESVIALSLTCRRLHSILSHDVARVQMGCRGRLLALLEKDLGDRFFYCSVCCQLHVFSPSWNPARGEHTANQYAKCNRFRCYARQLFNPNAGNSPYNLYVSAIKFKVVGLLILTSTPCS
jgi:hypothetical protein